MTVADTPEDTVEVLPEYLPPALEDIARALSDSTISTISQILSAITPREVAAVARDRRQLAAFLGHPSVELAREKLGLGGGPGGVYDRIRTQQDLGLALDDLTAIKADREVPHLTVDTIQSALRRDSMRFVQVPGMVEKTLPGYDGPRLSERQVRDLAVFAELVRGGAERGWRLGLLRAECRIGLGEFEQAIRQYRGLLEDPDSGPTKRKFLALRSAMAHLAMGDARFSEARQLNDAQRAATRFAYRRALALLRRHRVTPRNLRRRQVTAHAQRQLAKLAAGLNVLGLRDSFVPVQRHTSLRQELESRLRDAQDAADRYREYLEKANQREDLELELNQEVGIAKLNVSNAIDRKTNAADRIKDVTNQIEAISTAQNFLDEQEVVETGGSFLKAVVAGIAQNPVAFTEAGLGFISGDVSRRARREELQHQLRSAQFEQGIAERDEQIAGRDEQIATLQRDFLAEKLATTSGRDLNSDLYYALARRCEQLTESHMDEAIRLAFLYERAVAFFLGRLDIPQIALDYRKNGGVLGLLTAPGGLGADVELIERVFTDETRDQPDPFTLKFSLTREYPIEFARLQQSGESGEIEFAISLYQLEKRIPGTHQVRIVGAAVVLEGLRPTSGFSGELTHMGRFLVRDKKSTLDPPATRLIPTEEELEDALEQQRLGGAQAAVGGVIPYSLDDDTIQLDEEDIPDPADERVLSLLEGYGPAGLWRIKLRGLNLRRLTNLTLRLRLQTLETDPFGLGPRVEELIARYEQELGPEGAALDRVRMISLREKGVFDELEGGTAILPLLPEDFAETDIRVKFVVAQALDVDDAGVEGISLEISRPGTSFQLSRTTVAGGFSEDFSGDLPIVERPEDRPPAEGSWQLRLPVEGQFSPLDGGDLRLFFLYTFRSP